MQAAIDALGYERPEAVVSELGSRWQNGKVVLHPSDPTLQTKEVPLEVFFHKVVGLRNQLRVLEQKVNAHPALADAEKSAKVRDWLDQEAMERLFAPTIPDGLEEQFFPAFATLRHPEVSAHLVSKFGKLSKPWREHWHSRLWVNALGAMAEYDNELYDVLRTEGVLPKTERAIDAYLGAISKNWGFALWSHAAAKATPDKTYFSFDLLAMKHCFVIETAESRVDGNPGGWHLLEEILHVLDHQGIQSGVPWIHATTTNPDATSIFRKYGFADAPGRSGIASDRARKLRKKVTLPARPFDEPPSDVKHLLP